jgi:hypothetical protein
MIKSVRCPAVLIAAMLVTVGAVAKESLLLERARAALDSINSLDYQADDGFSFTKAITSKEGNRVIQYNPSKANSWLLLSLEGDNPSAEQQRDYQLEVLKFQQSQRQDIAASKGNPLLKLLDRDSLQLMSTGEIQSEYRFKVNDEKYRPFIDGLVVVQNDCQCVTSVLVSNAEKFSPQFMVSINDYRESYTFTPLDRGGSVISRIDKSIRGSAFLTDLSQDYSEVYTSLAPIISH